MATVSTTTGQSIMAFGMAEMASKSASAAVSSPSVNRPRSATFGKYILRKERGHSHDSSSGRCSPCLLVYHIWL